MRLSAFTDILGLDFAASLDALAGIGLRMIDLRSKIGPDSVDTLQGEAAKRAREAIASRGLAVGCVASWGVNPMTGDYDPADAAYRQAMRERTGHLAELAAYVGAPHVRVYSFKRPRGSIPEAYWADNAAFLSQLAGICATRGRLLLVENEPPTLTATCAELGDLMRRDIPESLRVNWDIVNGWRAGEVPWDEGVFDPMAGYVAQVHVKGARAGGDGSFATMAVPGQDDVPHAKVFGALIRSGFDGIVTIDPHYSQFADADKVKDVEDPVLAVVETTKTYLEGLFRRLGDAGVVSAGDDSGR